MSKKFNISILGDKSVGKTSIIHVLSGTGFSETLISTIGIDYIIQEENIEGTNYSFKIYDTAGQERYRSMSSRTIKSADGFILVFDVRKKSTLKNIESWLTNIQNQVNINEKIIILVGNKIDGEYREINKEEAIKYAKDNNMKYFETSAKLNIGIKDAFNEIYKDLAHLYKGIKDEVEEKKEKEEKNKMDDNNKTNNENQNFQLDKNTFNEGKKEQKKKNWFKTHCLIN